MGDKDISRRDFVRTAAGTAAGIMAAKTAFGSAANSAITIGICGCGWRGNHLTKLLKLSEQPQIRVVALADLFEDRLEQTRLGYAEDGPKAFKGFDGYQGMMTTNCDAVLITSPPYFHPEQFEAAVAAGKHVYLEKPVAIDTAGAQRVQAAGEKAKGRLTVFVGFQNRSRADLLEGIKRIRGGAVGNFVSGTTYYNAGFMGPKDSPGMSAEEARLRNWVFDKVLSGDILVEQNIHVLDVNNWVLDNHPAKAFGTGGRKVRTNVGDTWDHYEVTYWYPNDVMIVFTSTQFLDLGWGDAQQRFYGAKGAFESLEGDSLKGSVRIRAEQPWAFESEMENPEIVRLQAFIDSVQKGAHLNETRQGVDSTLTAILGRTAAYRGQSYTWEEMLKENERLDGGLKT
jgi:myo-inositol 2-dehydrogenase / D-chiro-inositol 1-dehydrogenase